MEWLDLGDNGWNGWGRNRRLPILSNSHGIFPQEMKNLRRNSVMIVGVTVGTRTKHLPNKSNKITA
jgi:hypothetical protein